MRQVAFAIFVCAAIFARGASLASEVSSGDSITLEGSFERVWAYGPPNYGENPQSDKVINYYVIILESPISVIDRSDADERKVQRVRLLPKNAKTEKSFTQIENYSAVRAVGTIRLSYLAIELEQVLLEVSDVKPEQSK